MNELTAVVAKNVLDAVQLGKTSPEEAISAATKEILEALMLNVRYNQSKAADKLGISRGKLRADLEKYFGDKYIGHKA